MSEIEVLVEKLAQMNKTTRDAIIEIIAKRPNQRTQKELESILPIVTWKTNFLRKVDKDVAIEILKKSQHLKCKRDFIIMKQGGVGDSGCVSVYRNDKLERIPSEPEPEPEKKLKSLKQKFRKCVRLAPLTLHENESTAEEKTLDRSEFGERVNQLGSGKSFGEIALIYADTPRNTTIIADKATDLLVISRKLFNHTIKIFKKHDIQERKVFAAVHPFFSKWGEEDQKQLQRYLVKNTFPAGSTIIRQGETTTSVKFLLRGKAKLSAEPAKHEQQFPELYTWYKNSQLEEDIWKHLGDQKKMRIPACSMFSEEIRVKRSKGYSDAEKILHGKSVEISVLECGEFLNDLEIILSLETNIFRVVCLTECEVYTLDKKAFHRLVVKRNPHTLQLMKLAAQTNLNSRLIKPSGKKLEFLHILSSYMNHLRIGSKGLIEESQTSRMTPLLPALNDDSRRYRVMKMNREAIFDWYKQGKSPYLRPYTIGPILHKHLMLERTKCQDDKKKNQNLNAEFFHTFKMREKQVYEQHSRKD